MSPVPLIELQRRLSLVGAIRAGGEKPERGVGRKLENWRITSPRQQLVQQAAELYGGEVSKWTSPVGDEWQVYTQSPELPVLLMPAYSLRQTYELWEGATKRTRLCDGMEEEISGGPCRCNAEGKDLCDLYTRLVVCLPELDTMLGWKVITRGANAAHELPTMIDAARATTDSPFVPARLRLEQRRGVVEGQVARFVVPVLDLGVGYAALAAAQSENRELEAATTVTLRSRRSAPWGPESISPAVAIAPAVSDEVANDQYEGPTVADVSNEQEDERQQTAKLQRDEPMWRKLNVLVGKLREAGLIETAHLYDAIGNRMRKQAGLDLAATLEGGLDADGTLHWGPLRDDLTRAEAHYLIERLVPLEARLPAPPAPAEPEQTEIAEYEAQADRPEHITVPYNEFPPGY
jgi:recombination directionality factor gp3-like protein